MKADETAQQLRRILCPLGDTWKDLDVFVTKRVNYGDRPAGCILIAGVSETAERFRGGREEGKWFLNNRTYIDDTTGDVHDKENSQRISQNMESIIENWNSILRRRS